MIARSVSVHAGGSITLVFNDGQRDSFGRRELRAVAGCSAHSAIRDVALMHVGSDFMRFRLG
jgi:peptidyl-tRNA hydrolase